MDIGRSINFLFEDPEWKRKVLIGGLLYLLPVVGWLIIGGYYLRLIQRVVRDEPVPMPEWDDYGADLVRGFKVAIVHFVYFSPLIVMACSALFFLFQGEEILGIVGLMAYNIVALPYVLVLSFFTPVYIGRLAADERIADAFQFGAMLEEVKGVWTQLLIFAGATYLIGMMASMGYLLCLVGIIFTSFVAYAINGHMLGQIRKELNKSGAGSGESPDVTTAPAN